MVGILEDNNNLVSLLSFIPELIILEGMICNKLIYKCSFSDFFDNYGYVKNKLVLKEYSNPQI